MSDEKRPFVLIVRIPKKALVGEVNNGFAARGYTKSAKWSFSFGADI
jgi:hypothetical protein